MNLVARLFIVFGGLILVGVATAPAFAVESTEEEALPEPSPGPGDDELIIRSADGQHSLRFNGRIHLRYVLEIEDYNLEHSTIFIRRLEPEVNGSVFGGLLTFKVRPEISAGAALKDGWVSYRVFDGLILQGGQFQVPFNSERDSAVIRQPFIERSVANSQFQAATGRDIGLMIHGVPLEKLKYGIGAFSNQGINAPQSDTTGHLFSGRITYALLGNLPNTEALLEPVTGIDFVLGAGAYLSTENTAKVWDQWYESETKEVNVWSVTTDLRLLVSRLSLHLEGFYRSVEPYETRPDSMPAYQGYGYLAQGGVLLVPHRLFLAMRYAATRPNFDEVATSEREALLGLQLYHLGHDSKLHGEVGQIARHDGQSWVNEQIARIQYQFLF